MSDERIPEEDGIRQLMEEHCSQSSLNDRFRRDLLDKTHSIVRRRRAIRLTRFMALAAAVAVVMFFFIHSSHMQYTSSTPDRLLAVTSIEGHASLSSGQTLSLGDRVAAGSAIVTKADGMLALVTRNGSILRIAPNSRVSVDTQGNTKLTEGRLYCQNRLHDIKRIDTPSGQIHLLGTSVDTNILGRDTTAVTVIEGKVRLVNSHGGALVEQGKRSLLKASRAPSTGASVNTLAETKWVDGRNDIVSDTGEIVYLVRRNNKNPYNGTNVTNLVSEVWAMKADGSGKHKVVSGFVQMDRGLGAWCPGSRWMLITRPRLTLDPTELTDAGLGWRHAMGEVRMLNVATGQEKLIRIPYDYVFNTLFHSVSLSPDGRYLAFAGPHVIRNEHADMGVWAYDLKTAKIRKIVDARGDAYPGTPSWSPDGRYMATLSSDKETFQTPPSLIIADMKTGKIRKLNVTGFQPTISRDGTKLAYCNSTENHRPGPGGYPERLVGVFVCNLAHPSTSKMLSLPDESAFNPRWSPDGAHLLYTTEGPWPKNKKDLLISTVRTVNADGTGRKTLYSGRISFASPAAWSPNGKSVYMRTFNSSTSQSTSVLSVPADGSQRVHDLGGNEHDSPLRGNELSQVRNAFDDLQKTEFLLQQGAFRRLTEGNPAEARKYSKLAAETIGRIAWKYPLAKFDPSELTEIADTGIRATSRSDAYMLDNCCRWRLWMTYVRIHDPLLKDYIEKGKGFPSTLPEFPKKGYESGTVPGGALNQFGVTIRQKTFQYAYCPGTPHHGPVPFTYHPLNGHSKVGDVVLSCPNHPNNKQELNWHWGFLYVHKKK